MAKWSRWFNAFGKREEQISNEPWNLIALTPSYIPKEHEGYVVSIKAALNNGQIKNIALSGNYGVGKSSILQELARQLGSRAVELSLSTLAPIEATKLDESVPVQATTPANRIQQEIVKQLLYRENPSKTPGSRFRRIVRFRKLREVAVAMLTGLVASIIFLLAGWSTKIVSAFSQLEKIGVWFHPIVWGLAAASIFFVRWLFYGQFNIKQLSAGSATVTLDDKSVSYFDQYLDEIVYFFDVSKCDVVIFEDIDRFNDSHIFDALRALNTLLNASPHIKKPIRFIYAIKDSIFDHVELREEGRNIESAIISMTDSALANSMRSNRTKFFDLVIPVVPFITHRSARNLAMQLLESINHQVAPELIDLAARYVPDMRLLKNVRNEFIIFRDRIFSGDGEYLNLTETELFAMMLYKSTHLKDFETIRIGNSNLDALYERSRELVTENIHQIERERNKLRQRLTKIDGVTARSTHMGELLIAHLQRTAQASGFQENYATLTLNGDEKSMSDLKEEHFWTEFIALRAGQAALHWKSAYLGQNRQMTLSFSRDSIAAALGDPLDAESWNETNRQTINEQIDKIREDIRFLQSADVGDLIKRSDFLVEYLDSKVSFESVAQKILKPGLAYELVRAGHINRNFTLYTSTFHGDRVSSAATNFIIHHIDRDLMDEHFELAAEDVDAIIRERGKSSLKEPALYNIKILDRILEIDSEVADIMISSIAELGERQRKFLQAYLTSGLQRTRFIERFKVFYSKVLIYLVSEAELDDASRLELVSRVLSNISDSTQKTDSAVSKYLRDHYTDFSVITSNATKPDQAEIIAGLFFKASSILPSLASLGRYVRVAFVSRNLYEITRDNLVIAIDNQKSLALDAIHLADETVYRYVLNNLSAYLIASEGVSRTIDANERFIYTIEDIVKHDSSQLSDVIERALPACQVRDLAEVSKEAWLELIKHQRLPATFNNINRYFKIKGSVDVHLAKLLMTTGEITEIDGASEDCKISIAVAILAGKDHGLSASIRAELVAKMNLGVCLDIDEVAAETGEIFPLLLKNGIIADDVKSYRHLATTDWRTRELFICISKNFSSYITPDLVRPDLVELLSSNDIALSIKRAFINQAEEYADEDDPEALKAIAQFAFYNRLTVPFNVVWKMAKSGVPAQQVVSLLEFHLPSISDDEIFPILQKLGGEYLKLLDLSESNPKIPNTPANQSLIQRLKQQNFVAPDNADERVS